jgi:predicted site-specific integrase-resolvase
MPEQQSQQLLTEKEAAQKLIVAPETLQQWRHHRRYKLPYVKVGRLIRYRLSDLESFIASRTVAIVEPRAFVAQRAKCNEHRAALKRASTALRAVSRQRKTSRKKHSR